jgi:tetratricopeptide (TPR) repeat protein
MRRAISSIAFVVATLVWCPISIAQEPTTSTSRDACQKAPTRACLLYEALTRALSVEPSAPWTTLLGNVAETQAAAGDLQTALRVVQLIPSGQMSRVTALRSIASAQARLGSTTEAKETFIEARQFADDLADQLSRAEMLHSVAKAEAEAGMAAEANSAFEASLKLAAALEISADPSCTVSLAPETRLAVLLAALAEQQARAGSISGALQTARSIKYDLPTRARALRMIAGMQTQSGAQIEAGLILKEALEVVHDSQTPPEIWPSCSLVRHIGASAELYVEMLSDVAKAQAKAGFIEDAAATLVAALQVVPTIKDNSVQKADVATSLVLTKIAEALSEAGLGPQSAATFERAAQAASEVREARWHVMALARLGRAQYQVGRVAEATRTFDDALELARTIENYPERASGLLTVLDAEVQVGLAIDTDTILLHAIEATRSIADPSKRVFLLVRIALAQEKAGRLRGAVDTYREALEAVDATSDKRARINVLFLGVRGWLGQAPVTRLIAESAPQVVRIAQSIENELSRAEALVVIAKALPNQTADQERIVHSVRPPAPLP